MSGHSKWSTIKHQKGAADAKRGVLFTKISRELTIAIKTGGGADPNMNFRLRLVLDKAKNANMPSDSITRAIKRGSGEGAEGETLEEITYEGYGPGGGAILLEILTTNRNRTASDVRSRLQPGRRQPWRERLRRLELRPPGRDRPGDEGRSTGRRTGPAGHRRRRG